VVNNNPKLNEGILLIDKPVGPTSFAIVGKVRAMSGIKKVGHAGTLDPLASGLMIVLVGKEFTKQADKFLKLDKTYQAELILGQTTTTYDAEGEITKKSAQKPSLAEIKTTLKSFVGEISQTPPIYSALKIAGQPAYKLARAGEEVKLAPRQVKIYSISNIIYKYPKLSFITKVSSGTYIRSLANDIGDKLGTGAYLSGLRRTQIGQYKINQALKLDFK